MSVPLPDGLVLDRTTDEFDEHTVPAGLLRDHRVAAGVWGRLAFGPAACDSVSVTTTGSW
jgi:tellurite resistance-related uncharacterized protein